MLALVVLGAAHEWADLAATVNAAGVGWTADPLASGFATVADAAQLCGTWLPGHPNYTRVELPAYERTGLALPDSFDPKTKWPQCTVIQKVRNQAGCGSCWAFGATESFEGRRCAATKKDTEFSADDTAACSAFFGNGCDGGQPTAANDWFARKGVVTGGEYGTNDGCLPYVCPPCKHGLYPPGCPTDQCNSLLKCTRKCSNSAYPKSYEADKTKAVSAFSAGSVEDIQEALMTSGPLAAAFTVYADFPTYKSGVYKHTTGGVLGGHAIVLLGWGTEDGQDYWLVKNSWSAQWGDNGFFKIAKGVNECGIENDVSGTHFGSVEVVV